MPCIAIAGSIGTGVDTLRTLGISAVFSLCPGPISLEQAVAAGGPLISDATEQAVLCYVAGLDHRSRA